MRQEYYRGEEWGKKTKTEEERKWRKIYWTMTFRDKYPLARSKIGSLWAKFVDGHVLVGLQAIKKLLFSSANSLKKTTK